MTDHGLAYVIYRLGVCPNLEALRRVWGNLGVEYQRHPEVIAMKDRLKEGFENEQA